MNPRPDSPPITDLPQPWLTALLIWVAYVAVGWACLRLAAPPVFAVPLFAPAGIALAALLVYGWRMAPAVALGAGCIGLMQGLERGLSGGALVGLPLCIGLAASLQAVVGAALVQRFVRQPLTLSEPRDVLLFYALGAGLASALGASGSVLSLHSWNLIPPGRLLATWTTWWSGDALGSLVVAPAVLTLIGRPRSEWAPRRVNVGLSLVLGAALVGLALWQMLHWSGERLIAAFERDAASVSLAMEAQLREPLQALEALHGVFIAAQDVSTEEMHLAARAWTVNGQLQALGWSPRVRRADVPAFEAEAQADGLPGFRVFNRNDLPAKGPAPLLGDDLVVMRYVEPLPGNAPALGVNVLSIPAARAAIEAAVRNDRPVASAGFRLTQQPAHQDATGVVVYRAIYRRPDAPVAERASDFLGVVFVTTKMDVLLATAKARFPGYLSVCLVDTDQAATRKRLAGAAGCENDHSDLQHRQAVSFADRQWELRVSAHLPDVPGGRNEDGWLFTLVGLLASSLLGALLLTVTGRTRRIETAVRERTAALEGEVSEREEAEAALRESEQRFRNILNNVPIGITYTDLDGQVIQTNPRFCELTGYAESELLQMSAAQFTHPDDRQEEADLIAQLVRGEIPAYRRHQRYLAKDGHTVWVQSTVSLLRDSKGEPRRIVGVVEDITEHLRLQEAENARERAEASNLAKSEFLSRMSHELRTPLNAMLGFAQLLDLDQRHPLAAAQRPWVNQIQEAGWHLLEMINDVLDLSRIESGNLRLHTEVLDLQILVAATVAMVAGEAQRNRITITTDLPPGSVNVMGDGTRVKQILTNLLTNAVKYNLEGGRVHVNSRMLESGMAEIAVTDTGLGMSEAQMAELFQPFNRLGRERSQQQGTGIGLVISQRLAELMHGSLRAHSRAGEGSSFVLSLPGVDDPDTIRSDFDDGLVPDPAYHKRIVHYVEDNETNIEVMRGMLAQRPQVQMHVSTTGLDGLLAIRARRPDLILLDMHLPDISGLELLRHLKADAATSAIPVVVVSADALSAQVEAGLAAGAQRYLTKPVAVNTLLEVVDELLGQAETRFG